MRAAESVTIAASISAVWTVLADIEHWNTWTPTVTQVVALNSTELKLGAKYRITQPKLRPAIYEVTAFSPNEAFTWVQTFPGGQMFAEHRLTERDKATEFENAFSSHGLFGNLAGLLFSKTIKRYIATEAASLKKHCEALP
jgi:uncharacterized protein YndB with AHSA1/START domain